MALHQNHPLVIVVFCCCCFKLFYKSLEIGDLMRYSFAISITYEHEGMQCGI